MILFPAIDLIAGKVVRLERGDRSRCKVYSDDPVAVARSFAEQGASWVHVVDLSAAFGEDEDACAANSAAIKAICGVDGLSVDVGGGVRSLARIDELAGYGARRIALGTVLVTEPGFAEVAARGFGELLVADIAARDGQVKVNGWRDGAGVALDDAVAQLSELGFKHLVYTDIARDGMQTGIDVAAYRHVAQVAGFPVVASGGISTLDDIRALAAVGEDAIEGAITGRHLHGVVAQCHLPRGAGKLAQRLCEPLAEQPRRRHGKAEDQRRRQRQQGAEHLAGLGNVHKAGGHQHGVAAVRRGAPYQQLRRAGEPGRVERLHKAAHAAALAPHGKGGGNDLIVVGRVRKIGAVQVAEGLVLDLINGVQGGVRDVHAEAVQSALGVQFQRELIKKIASLLLRN